MLTARFSASVRPGSGDRWFVPALAVQCRVWNGIMVDFTVSMKSILVFPISYYDFDSWCRLLASSIHAGSVTGASSQLTRRLTVTRQLTFTGT
jgi:hypothetical protein